MLVRLGIGAIDCCLLVKCLLICVRLYLLRVVQVFAFACCCCFIACGACGCCCDFGVCGLVVVGGLFMYLFGERLVVDFSCFGCSG